MVVLTPKWLAQYDKVKDLLVSPVDFGELFTRKKVQGNNLFVLNMGTVNFPTGNILVRDPLSHLLDRKEEPYFQKVPSGIFPLDTLVAEMDEDEYRYIATRIKFSDNKAVVYRQALKGNENLEDADTDSIYGFYVDAGLASIVDIQTRDKFCDIMEEWEKENPGRNMYDDYFADLFEKSYESHPTYQREGGDWLNFQLKDTDLSVPMIQSGFGDGVYPVYLGYDENDNICELIVEYIYVGK